MENQNFKMRLAEEVEDVFAKADAVSVAQAIVDKFQDMAQDVSTTETKEIMPLFDKLTATFGPEFAKNFNAVATEQTRNLITAIQNAKAVLDQEIMRMKQGVEGGDTSDMGMMGNNAPGMAPEGDEAPAMDDGSAPTASLPEVPPGADNGMDDDAMGNQNNFAGRARKESARRKGKMVENQVDEDFLGANAMTGINGPEPVHTPPAEYKSPHHDDNLGNANGFHGGAGKIAHEIAAMVANEPITGNERKALSNILSHFCSVCHEPSHWGIDTETKLTAALKANGLYEINKPAVAKIVDKMRDLVGTITHAHKSMMESAIRNLRKSENPDGMILHTFRKKLSESHDAQLAAIRTARTFAIDLDDVVCIIREAAKEAKKCTKCDGTGKIMVSVKGPKGTKKEKNECSTCKGTGEIKKKAVKEAKKEQNEEGRGKFKVNYVDPKGKTISNDRFETKAEANKFAADLRKKGYKDVTLGESVVREENFVQNPAFFPVGAKSAADASGGKMPGSTVQPPGADGMASNVEKPKPNQSSSTIKSQSPADMRFRQQQQKAAAQQQQPMVDDGRHQTMVPPQEKDEGDNVPSTQNAKKMPVRQVPGQKKSYPPEMPGRIVR